MKDERLAKLCLDAQLARQALHGCSGKKEAKALLRETKQLEANISSHIAEHYPELKPI